MSFWRRGQLALIAFALATSVLAPGTSALAAQAGGFSCTEVIGYSQTREWFTTGFQSVASSGQWQLRGVDGASIDQWASLDFPGWRNSNVTAQCARNASAPDRVVLDVSGDYHSDVNWWSQQTTLAIANIHKNRPSARQIVLEPVVGGPGGAQCPVAGGKIVRASFNHPYIDQAFNRLVGGDVVRGPDPTVRSCADYTDDIGHMTPAAQAAVGTAIAQFWTSGGAPGAPATPGAPSPAPAAPAPAAPAPAAPDAPAPAAPPAQPSTESAASAPAPAPPSGETDFCTGDASPQYSLGFLDLSQRVGGAMGEPTECEHGNPDNGDTLQATSTGLAFYRQSTNTPTFTDGFQHWAITPTGLITWTGPGVDPP